MKQFSAEAASKFTKVTIGQKAVNYTGACLITLPTWNKAKLTEQAMRQLGLAAGDRIAIFENQEESNRNDRYAICKTTDESCAKIAEDGSFSMSGQYAILLQVAVKNTDPVKTEALSYQALASKGLMTVAPVKNDKGETKIAKSANYKTVWTLEPIGETIDGEFVAHTFEEEPMFGLTFDRVDAYVPQIGSEDFTDDAAE